MANDNGKPVNPAGLPDLNRDSHSDAIANENLTKKPSGKWILAIVLVIIAAVVVLAAELTVLYSRQERAAGDREAFDRVTAEFDSEFPAFLEKQYEDFPLAKKAEASVETTVQFREDIERLSWNEHITVTVFVTDEFDRLSYHDVSSNLEDVEKIVDSSQKAYAEKHPEYKDFRESGSDENRAFNVWHGFCEPVIRIKTTENTYERAPVRVRLCHVEYYLNGKDQYRPHSSTEKKNTSSGSGSTYYYKKSDLYDWNQEEDPYNARDYYTAEDFYDDYYDEFDSFEDAENYFEDRDN